MASVRCFMIEPTDRVARWLRRYLSAETGGARLCEPEGYHNAMVRIDDGPCIESGPRRSIHTEPMEWPADDPRWPARCEACGYEFHDREVRQLFYQRIYRTPDGREVTIHEGNLPGIEKAPPGAMFYADWFGETEMVGPDGRSLAVMTPAGVWLIDVKRPGATWTRTGTPPNVTARPSIHFVGRYHGFLTDGQLVEC